MTIPSQKKLPAQSLAKGLEILEFVAFSRRAVRLKDIADKFKMDMASTHRVLKTLEEMEYVARLSIGKTYGPGEKLQILAQSFQAESEMVKRLRPILVDLSKATGQVAHIALLKENHAILVEVALSSEAKIVIQQAPGDVDELHCSAVGKSILANLPDFEQKALMKNIIFEKRTPFTITSKVAFKRELEEVRATGIAFDDCEGDLEVACIGAPILDEDGFAVAALGISTLSNVLSGSIRDEQGYIDFPPIGSKPPASSRSASANLF